MSDTLDKLVKEACENGRSEAVRLMKRDYSHAVVKLTLSGEYGTVRQ